MRIRTLSSTDSTHGFGAMHWNLSVVGAAVDERGETALQFARDSSNACMSCEYLLDKTKGLLWNAQRAPLQDIVGQIKCAESLLIEATTLGLVEILLLIRAVYMSGIRCFDVLYVEPFEYRRSNSVDAPWLRDFSLSNSRRFEGVHGFLINLSVIPEEKGRLITFLGYEGARLAQACEQLDLVGWAKYAVFGIPSYAPGWEINAFANNVAILEREQFSSVRYCPASGVSLAYDLLEKIHKESGDGGTTVVAALGTKPHGIASALFLNEYSQYQQTALIYDHPSRSANRSSKVRRWHLYRIDLDDS